MASTEVRVVVTSGGATAADADDTDDDEDHNDEKLERRRPELFLGVTKCTKNGECLSVRIAQRPVRARTHNDDDEEDGDPSAKGNRCRPILHRGTSNSLCTVSSAIRLEYSQFQGEEQQPTEEHSSSPWRKRTRGRAYEKQGCRNHQRQGTE